MNDEINDLIIKGYAALNSTADMTDADLMLAQERDQNEKAIKDLEHLFSRSCSKRKFSPKISNKKSKNKKNKIM